MSGPSETHPGLVTPHASALALITPLSSEAIANLQAIPSTSDCAYDAFYGFRDSLMADPSALDYGECSSRFSALAQECIFLAIANHETGFIWEYFYRDPAVRFAHQEMFGKHQLYLPLILAEDRPSITPPVYLSVRSILCRCTNLPGLFCLWFWCLFFGRKQRRLCHSRSQARS